jgi:3-carboxy-cis,cis-muconate cycloisomerase
MPLVLSSSIFAPAFSDSRAAELVSDEAFFRCLLEVEVALARSQALLGIIPDAAAAAIAAAAASLPFDAARLARGVLTDGVPIIALVAQLRGALDPAHASFVHLGATSQDIVDTATVLCVRRVLSLLDAGLCELMRRAGGLARAHRRSVMAARTHAQQALPQSFGLKVASWALPLARHRDRLFELDRRFGVVQLGGAAGTLGALGPHALGLADVLATQLGLDAPELPWHTQRDNIAELGSWLALYTGSLAKLAQDVILLCQSEVAELSEAAHGTRGKSSSMPQKNNPMRSEQILAAARVVSAQLPALTNALVQEHERGTHGWQVEWLCLSPMLLLCAGAAENTCQLLGELCVYPERMRENLLANHGLVLAEPAVSALSREIPRSEASALVGACAARAIGERRYLMDVVREEFCAQHPESRIDWASLATLESHLGQSDALIDRALGRLELAISRPALEAGLPARN